VSNGVINVQINILPKSYLGRWSVGLAIASILYLFWGGVLTTDWTFGPEFNTVLAVVLKIILVGIPIAVLVTGLTSIIKLKERSVLVLMSIAVGLWFLIAGMSFLMGAD